MVELKVHPSTSAVHSMLTMTIAEELHECTSQPSGARIEDGTLSSPRPSNFYLFIVNLIEAQNGSHGRQTNLCRGMHP